jgi:hypothetical protein
MRLLAITAVFSVTLGLLGRAVGYASPWFALIAMFDFLGIIAFGRALFVVRIPRVLYEVSGWEARGRAYRALGVPAFGQLLRRSPLRRLNPTVYLHRSPTDAAEVLKQIERSEAAHWWAAVLVTPYMLYVAVQGWWGVVSWFVLIQILVNLYPILHLRWARIRLRRMIGDEGRRRAPMSGDDRPLNGR